MLTLFALPKPFTDPHIAVLQRNAITSWTHLHPEIEVILFGDEPGVADFAAEAGVRHDPSMQHNEFGTPLLNHVFDRAQRAAQHNIVAYINADIILLPDFLAAVQRLATRPQFLMIGQRIDTPIDQPIDFTDPDWRTAVRQQARAEGVIDPPMYIDYFVFRNGLYPTMPPFAVGRAAYDHWFIYHARRSNVPVFDASPVVTVVHQRHGGRQYLAGNIDLSRMGEEQRRNLALASVVNGEFHNFTLHDATHRLTATGAPLALQPAYLWRRLMAETVIHPPLHPIYALMKSLRNRWEGRPPAPSSPDHA